MYSKPKRMFKSQNTKPNSTLPNPKLNVSPAPITQSPRRIFNPSAAPVECRPATAVPVAAAPLILLMTMPGDIVMTVPSGIVITSSEMVELGPLRVASD